MRSILPTTLLGLLATCYSVAAVGQGTYKNGGFLELQRAEVIDAHEFEAIMGLIERSGESVSGKHYHPGGEFGFVIEGTVTITSEKEPRQILNAGDSFYQRAGEWHIVSTASEGAKTVVFRVVKDGQPMVVPVE